MIDYQIIMLDKMCVNEMITENEDGSYTIFINNRLCEIKRIKALHHALTHMKNCDFEKELVQEIEIVAHR